MPINKLAITLISLLVGINSFSQNNNLQQKWFQYGLSGCRETDSYIDQFQKLVLQFSSDDSVKIWTSNFWQEDEAKYQTFTFDGSELTIEQRMHEVIEITADTLILRSSANDPSCEKYLFISEDKMYTDQLRYYTIFENDTIYFPNKYNFPTIEEGKSYRNYLTTKSSIMVTKNRARIKSPCNFKFKFIISSDGQVIRPSGSVDCLKKDQKFISQTIENSTGQWTPMYIKGKAVSTLIDFKFKHSGVQTFRRN